MYINWVHYYIPKTSFVLSIFSNPLFVYLIYSNKILFGSYRYLLTFFAVFNVFASHADVVVPVSVFAYDSVFLTFIADGIFFKRSDWGELPTSYRCCFIGGTYGILNVHFVFRYLTLNHSKLLNKYFLPHGLVLSVIYVICQMAVWGSIDFFCLHSAPDMRNYIRTSFQDLYNEDIDNINFVAGMFSNTSPDIIRRSWAGILSLTGIGGYSIVLYFVFGYKIVSGLNKASGKMSKKTKNMQTQLFKALAIQTVIPICVSFIPCSFTFYGAALRVDLTNWIYWISAVAISMFICMDPLAIIFFLPALRQNLFRPFIKGQKIISGIIKRTPGVQGGG